MPDVDHGTTQSHRPPPMTVNQLMALLEGYDRRSEVRLAFVIGNAAMQSVPTGLMSFTVAAVTSPPPPHQQGTVWIIAAKGTAPFPIEAWTAASYRRP